LSHLRAMWSERAGSDDRVAGERCGPVDPMPGRRPAAGAVCVRHGRRWRVEAAGQVAVVGHSVGMLHLAVLIANPGTEIAAVDVVAGVDALTRAANRGAGTVQSVLDHTAAQAYRRRLGELHQRIDELTAEGQHEAAAAAHSEREWIVGQLRAGTAKGGRSRAFTDNGERARVAVGRAIRRALANIAEVNPAVGAHLRDSVHTGALCWYRPVPQIPNSYAVDVSFDGAGSDSGLVAAQSDGE